jgi:hypothetical protein
MVMPDAEISLDKLHELDLPFRHVDVPTAPTLPANLTLILDRLPLREAVQTR